MLHARPQRHNKQALRCAAAQDDNSVALDAVKTGNIGPLTFVTDNETIQDVMAFTGPAPEVGDCTDTDMTNQLVFLQASNHAP